MYDLWKFYYSIYQRATLVWTFAMLLTGVKNWLFLNSVDILFWEIFQFCTQLCSHTACSLWIILQEALRKQSFFYAIFNSQNNLASMRRYPELVDRQIVSTVLPQPSLFYLFIDVWCFPVFLFISGWILNTFKDSEYYVIYFILSNVH